MGSPGTCRRRGPPPRGARRCPDLRRLRMVRGRRRARSVARTHLVRPRYALAVRTRRRAVRICESLRRPPSIVSLDLPRKVANLEIRERVSGRYLMVAVVVISLFLGGV